jgi:hypothetical protein
MTTYWIKTDAESRLRMEQELSSQFDITLGPWEPSTQSWRGCVIPVEQMNKLDGLWGLITWGCEGESIPV